MVANADLLENIHHVKLDPFFDDLSSFDEGDVYVSDCNSFSSCRNAMILSCVCGIEFLSNQPTTDDGKRPTNGNKRGNDGRRLMDGLYLYTRFRYYRYGKERKEGILQ